MCAQPAVVATSAAAGSRRLPAPHCQPLATTPSASLAKQDCSRHRCTSLPAQLNRLPCAAGVLARRRGHRLLRCEASDGRPSLSIDAERQNLLLRLREDDVEYFDLKVSNRAARALAGS